MKNLVFIFSMVCAMFVFSNDAEAQTYKRLAQGLSTDSMIQSDTNIYYFPTDPKSLTQAVATQVFIKKISGTPKGTATLYYSLDGTNYLTTAQSVTWSTGVDTNFVLVKTPYYGTYGKLVIITNGTTQKTRVTATMKSWDN